MTNEMMIAILNDTLRAVSRITESIAEIGDDYFDKMLLTENNKEQEKTE